MLQEAVEQTGGDGVVFKLSVQAATCRCCAGDPAQLERAFANVLENAARYSAGKPVSVRARAVGDRVRVLIVDQGPGIAPTRAGAHLPPVLPRADGRPERHHGSGLGLAIARGFLEVNGGRISVESLPGQGPSFVVEFPLLADGRAVAASTAAVTARPAGVGASRDG